MLPVLGFLVGLLTFPGVVVHEWAHAQFCDRLGVPVYEVVYFRLGSPLGYVAHAEPRTFRAAFAISGAPFLVNSALAVLLAMPVPALWTATTGASPVDARAVVLLWLALSVGMHAIPSGGDARSVWDRMWSDWRRTPAVLLTTPFVAAIYVLDLLRFVWADALYALVLAGAGWQLGTALV